MRQLVIKCDNVHQKIAAIALASAVGYTYNKQDVRTLVGNKNRDIYDMSYPHVLLKFDDLDDNHKNIIDFVTNSWIDEDVTVYRFASELEQINQAIFNRAESTVRISADYDAVVSKNGIQVGCQTISFEDFDKLAAIVKNIR